MQLPSSVRPRRVFAGLGCLVAIVVVGSRWFAPAGAVASETVGNRALPAATTTSAPVATVPPPATTTTTAALPLAGRYGYDLSWPQCDGPAPPAPGGFVVLGITGGRPFRPNRCLAAQWRWATGNGVHVGLYANLAAPHPGEGGPAAFGARTADHAIAVARAAGAHAPLLWLDVEDANHWDADPRVNLTVLRGAVDAVRRAGGRVGVYSTPRYWRQIMGGANVGLPVWVASTTDQSGAPSWCTAAKGFTGGEVFLVQALPGQFDANWACDALVRQPTAALHAPVAAAA
jgi:hypothetical protein